MAVNNTSAEGKNVTNADQAGALQTSPVPSPEPCRDGRGNTRPSSKAWAVDRSPSSGEAAAEVRSTKAPQAVGGRAMTMPSPLHREELVCLAKAAEWVRSRTGRKTHVSTLHRWALRGCGGRKLETLLIGRERMTSKEALGRFFEVRAGDIETSQSVCSRHEQPASKAKVARDVSELHQRLYGNCEENPG